MRSEKKKNEKSGRGERGARRSSPPSGFSTSSANRPTAVVIGAGRLGTALGRAMASAGYDVRAVVTKDVRHARRASKLIASRPAAFTSSQLDLLPSTDLLILAVPDDALAGVAARLATLSRGDAGRDETVQRRARKAARVALHASGALSSEVLTPLRSAGFAVGSLHPLASVSGDAEAGAESLGAAFYCVEGDGAAVRAARCIVRDLGGKSFSIRGDDKALYHAAAVMTSGHTVALFDTAARLLVLCGLGQRRAREVLLPLLQSTLANLSREPPSRALTGTFSRADVKTVRKHLDALRRSDSPEALATYALLGRHSLRLAEENGADAAALAEIARALAAGAQGKRQKARGKRQK